MLDQIADVQFDQELISFQFSTVVKTCEPAELTTQVNGKKQKLPGFEVILEDTILFPEGGGQV